MPDHLHWLLQLGDDITLGRLMHAAKGASARTINQALGRHGPLWQRGYHDHALRGHEDIRAIARYIAGNPLRAGLVTSIGDYPLWDAAWVNGWDSPCGYAVGRLKTALQYNNYDFGGT